jgi:hypothetical protein
MHGSTRGRRVAHRALIPLFVASIVAAGCDGGRASAAPSAGPSGGSSPAPATRLPTPVPTPVGPSGGPSPDGSPVAATANLILRLTTCDDTCGPTAGTTFLDDGRLLWEAPDGSRNVLVARLSDAAIATIREAIAATPALSTDGDYRATPRPGAEPIEHGVVSFRFDVQQATGPVVVTSWDPDSLADQASSWIFPPELATLADLAHRLTDPAAWLGSDAFVEPPVVYVPAAVVVRIDLFPDVGDIGGTTVDVDEVEWPFGEPIETAGDPIPGEETPAPRCVTLDAADAAAMRAAEKEAGASRNAGAWESTVEYDWRRLDGFVQVAVRALLPHQTGPCVQLFLDPA